MEAQHRAIIVFGLGFGDEAKGGTADYLTRVEGAHTVVRFNGGAQAAHNVITPNGRHHTFSQFGSGSFVSGVDTYLSRYMVCQPLSFLGEAAHLESLGVSNPFDHMFVDRRALAITPFQEAANRVREMARGGARHGSCGVGVGETVYDKLRFGDSVVFMGDIGNPHLLRYKLRYMQNLKRREVEDLFPLLPNTKQAENCLWTLTNSQAIPTTISLYEKVAARLQIVGERFVRDLFKKEGTIVFEGAQGVLLDERYGFHPYTTWSKPTPENALTLLDEFGFQGEVTTLGLLRGYGTRHGAGPFPTQDHVVSSLVQDFHNTDNAWQHEFRVGHFDTILARYAIEVSGNVDFLGLTCLDRLAEFPEWKVCWAYQYKGDDSQSLSEFFYMDEDKIIIGIKVDLSSGLERQEKLTKLLFDCHPIYETVDPKVGIKGYLAKLLEGLYPSPQLALTSFGPTSNDKKLMPAWANRILVPA